MGYHLVEHMYEEPWVQPAQAGGDETRQKPSRLLLQGRFEVRRLQSRKDDFANLEQCRPRLIRSQCGGHLVYFERPAPQPRVFALGKFHQGVGRLLERTMPEAGKKQTMHPPVVSNHHDLRRTLDVRR